MPATSRGHARDADTLWDRTTALGGVLASVDDAGDALLGHLRGRAVPDTVAAVVSNLSDYGLVWVLLAALKARRPGLRRRRALVALTVAGTLSYSVNRAAKALARRDRPRPPPEESTSAVARGSDVLPVRAPRSPSFPSGHTLAAFCTAAVLAEGPAEAAASAAFATVVAASRVHLRAHHLSDVLAGALLGAVAGALARPFVDALCAERGQSRSARAHME